MESFDNLARQYTPLIYRIIHRLQIYKEIDHYYSIGLQALWEASIKFDGTSASFITFAYHLIKGRILNELHKKNKWDQRHALSNDPDADAPVSQPDVYLERETILCYCTDLTPYQERWVIDTFIHNKTLPEIAASCHVTISAVKSWRRGALAKGEVKEMPSTMIEQKRKPPPSSSTAVKTEICKRESKRL